MDSLMKDTMVNMKWTDIQEYVDKKAVVLIPLGVIEEHGPVQIYIPPIYIALK